MSEIQPELMTRLFAVAHAIDNVLVAEHGPRSRLLAPPPWDAPLSAGVAKYGEGPLFELWTLCRAIEGLRLAWTGRSDPVVTPAELPAPDDATDEAGGLAVPVETAEPRAEQQQRLAG